MKVLDLGMAHAFGRRRLEGGTPGYMAPEQLQGAPEDERTDVFALGVMLYGMPANELPYATKKLALEEAAPVLHVPGAPGLGELVASMLQADPVKRPRDASGVLEPLTGFLRALEQTSSDEKVRKPSRRRRSPRWAVGIAAAIAACLGAAITYRIAFRPRPASPAVTASIAVLPLAELSPQRDQEYFSDGLSEEILNALARIDGLRVPSRTSCFFFKGKSARLADIGRELKVAAVLEGTVRRSGNRVQVTVEIVSVSDGFRLWGQTYDRELSDIFAVQDEIARGVAGALDVKLLSGRPLEKADAAYRRHLQIAPDTLAGVVGLGRNLLLQSKPAEALATFDRCQAEDYKLWGRALAELALGHQSASQAALDTLISKYAATSAARIADVYASRGEKDTAFQWLERASAIPGTVEDLKANPLLRDLRRDPRFAALLRKMKLPVE